MIATDIVEGMSSLVALAAVAMLALVVRRRALSRLGGTVELSLRAPGHSWVLGVGRFNGDALEWFRVFSFAMRPRRRLTRRDLSVVARREPVGSERRALLSGSVVMECRSSTGPVDLAMGPSAVTGFLAWLEATPPGATLQR